MSGKSHSLRKAAILVASLETEMADKLLEQMPEEQAAPVRRMVVDLGELDPREQDNVINEFFKIGPTEEEPEQEPTGVELALSTQAIEQAPAGTAIVNTEPTPFSFLHEAKGEK